MVSPAGCLRPASRQGFTLLELVISILIVAILASMLFPVAASVRDRVEKGRCVANLRGLHVAASLYVQDHKMWPQLTFTQEMEPKDVAKLWIDTLEPYGLTQPNWVCPTVQRYLNSPDFSDPENKRIDYAGTMFDSNPQTPFRWSTQPWFVETGNVHGQGNLIIFPDGHLQTMDEFMSGVKSK